MHGSQRGRVNARRSVPSFFHPFCIPVPVHDLFAAVSGTALPFVHVRSLSVARAALSASAYSYCSAALDRHQLPLPCHGPTGTNDRPLACTGAEQRIPSVLLCSTDTTLCPARGCHSARHRQCPASCAPRGHSAVVHRHPLTPSPPFDYRYVTFMLLTPATFSPFE